MNTSLYEDILKRFTLMFEQVPPPPPPPGGDLGIGGAAPTSPLGDGDLDAAAPPAGEEDNEASGESEKEQDLDDMVENGQPPISENDPIGAIYDYGMALGKQTVDQTTVFKGIKSAIQANFKYLDNDIKNAWPLVERFRNTENQLMINIAERLSLFISGTIQENHKRAYMKVSKEEIRTLVREALQSRHSTNIKEINISAIQLENVIQNVVHKVVKENSIFDSVRSQVGHVRSGIEQQLLSTDIQDMAIDLFEKICQKVGIDSENLNPDAEAFIKTELNEMIVSAQELGVKLMQVATVIKTAKGDVTSSSNQEEG